MSTPLLDAENMAATLKKLGFEITPEGDAIGYKTFGVEYKAPSKWRIASGSIINEDVDMNVNKDCSHGINVGSPRWIWVHGLPTGKLWKILIKKEWFPGVVAPTYGDGKVRCERAMIIDGYYNVDRVYDYNKHEYTYTVRQKTPMKHPAVKSNVSVVAARPPVMVATKPKMLKIVRKAAKASVVRKPAKKVVTKKAAKPVVKTAKKPVKRAAKRTN